MSQNSPRMQWPYPTREDDPWFDTFEDFIRANDASGFAAREDRSIIWAGGGTLTWTLSSETLEWTGVINVYSPIGAHLLQIEADSIADWADGEVVYVVLTRQPLENVTATLVKASQLPSTDNAMSLAVRIGSVIYFRTGISLGDGDTATGIAPVPGGGGGSALEVEDEGISVDAAVVNMDFVGGGVVASQTAAGHVQVAIPGGGVDPNAIHDNVAAEISAITPKAVPIAADLIVIEDSAAGNAKKSVQVGNLPGGGGGGVFEIDVPNNEIQPITADIGRSFIVGSQDMDDSGAANDARMFFNKTKGAFRAGKVNGAQWDDASVGWYSHAEGSNTTASYTCSHAEGKNSISRGYASHAEGYGGADAYGWASHVEGWGTYTQGTAAHAEGFFTKAHNPYSHAEGLGSETNCYTAHAEGSYTVAGESASNGDASHAEGNETYAKADFSHAEGSDTIASGEASHAEGSWTRAEGYNSHAEGYYAYATGEASHAEGWQTRASGDRAHAEGESTVASGMYSHSEGIDSKAYIDSSHASSSGLVSGSLLSQFQRATVGGQLPADVNWHRLTLGGLPTTFSIDPLLVVPQNHTWAMDIVVTARDAAIADGGLETGDSAVFFFKAAVKDIVSASAIASAIYTQNSVPPPDRSIFISTAPRGPYKSYRFRTILDVFSYIDGYVLLGATAADCRDNLVAAINLGPGAGTGGGFSQSGTTTTYTAATGTFTAAMVGQTINVLYSAISANNGAFVITSYINPTTVTYTNASGVTAAGSGSWAVLYSPLTTLHPWVSAAVGGGNTLVATAKFPGSSGNLIAVTENMTDPLSIWSSQTLIGGGNQSFIGGVSPIVPQTAIKDPAAVAWDCQLVLGPSSSLDIECKGEASRQTIWEAAVHITEIETIANVA